MLKHLKNLAKREPAGSLSGKQLSVADVNVKVDKVLGEGGQATIYRCTDVETGATYALKHLMLSGNPDAPHDVSTELGVMEALRGCPYIVALHEAAFSGPPSAPQSAVLLMDFCPDTLTNYLHQRGFRLDDLTLLRIFLPVCRAVQAMHSMQPPLAHRDLKAENVLLGPTGRWVLCDFGSACARQGVLESAHEIALEEEVVRKYTTPAYRAPELYDLYAREFVGLPVDIWALGVLLYLLCFGRLPFEGEAKLQVLNGRYVMPEGRAPALRALIRDMLSVSPRERPTIHQVLDRLVEVTPPDLWQSMPGPPPPQQQHAQQAAQQTPPRPPSQGSMAAGASASSASASASVGAAASVTPPFARHERLPSQGWADFASDGGSPAVAAASGAFPDALHRRRSSSTGSGSWATFSPTKAGDAGGLGVATAGTGPAAPAASAGSFWSSFGEEVPVVEASSSQQQAQHAAQPAQQQAHVAQQAPPPPGQQQQQQQPTPPPVQQLAGVQQAAAPAATLTPASKAAAAAALPPPPAAAKPAVPLLETSPLSAGLAFMSQSPFTAAAAKAPVPPDAASPALLQPSGSGGSGLLTDGSETEELRQHCRVLEELLEARNEELSRLRALTEQQAEELRQLRQQVQRQQHQHQNGSTSAAAAAAAAPQPSAAASTAAPATAGSTPSSSRLGQDVLVHVPADSPGTSWVSFGAAGSRRDTDAPTPTLLQPATGSFRSSSSHPARSSTAEVPPATASTGAATRASVANASTPIEEALRAKLELSLGSGSGGLIRTPSSEVTQQPMRAAPSGSTSTVAAGGTATDGSQQQHQGMAALRGFPGQQLPLPEGPKSAPASAQPSPMRTGSMKVMQGASGARSPMQQPSSPIHSRPSSGGSGTLGGSPTKHRRNFTAPDGGFFDDLNPLH